MLLPVLLLAAVAAAQHTTVFHMPPGATNATFVVNTPNTTNVTYLVQYGGNAAAQLSLPGGHPSAGDCLLSTCDENDVGCDARLPLCGPLCPPEACSRVNCSACWQTDSSGPCCWSCCLPPFPPQVSCPTEPCFTEWPYPYPLNVTSDIRNPDNQSETSQNQQSSFPQPFPFPQAQPLPFPQPFPFPQAQPLPVQQSQPLPIQPFPYPQPGTLPVFQPQPIPIPYPQPQPVVYPQPIPVPQPRPVPVPQPVLYPQPRPVPMPQPVLYPQPRPVPMPYPQPVPLPRPVPYPQTSCYPTGSWPFLRCPPQPPMCYPWYNVGCTTPSQPTRLCYSIFPC